jgi:glycosyltransferase involved in cell wall biosynthesis
MASKDLRIGVDGRVFNHQDLGGVERYTHSIVEHLKPYAEIEVYQPKTKSRYSQHTWLQTGLWWKAERSGIDALFCPVMTGPFILPNSVPLVVTIHDLAFIRYPEMYGRAFRSYYRFTIPHVIRRASAIIALTNTERAEIEKTFPLSLGKIHVVHSGISEKFNQHSTFLQKEKIILAVASLNKHKNISTLIKAFGLVLDKIPHKLVLVGGARSIVSSDNEIGKELSKLPPDRVIATGHVSEDVLLDWYRRAEIFVFPSLFEGFGFPPLEAMASGCAVVASNRSCIPEVCGSGATYFEATDEKSLARKLIGVSSNPAMLSHLVDEGVKHSKKFSWNKAAEQTFDVIKSVC